MADVTDGERLKLLLLTRLTLRWRRWALLPLLARVGSATGLLFSGGISVLMAVTAIHALSLSPQPEPLLHLAFAAFSLGMLMEMALTAASRGEGSGSPLSHLPLPIWVTSLAEILESSLTSSTLLAGTVLLGMGLTLPGSPWLLLWRGGVLLLFLFHHALLRRGVSLLASHFLRLRLLRLITLLTAPLLAFALVLWGQQALMTAGPDWLSRLTQSVPDGLYLIPGSWFGILMTLGTGSPPGVAPLAMGGALLVTALLMGMVWVLEEILSGAHPATSSPGTPFLRLPRLRAPAWIPGALAAVTSKEFRTTRRNPYLLLGMGLQVAVVTLPQVVLSGAGRQQMPFILDGGMPGVLLFGLLLVEMTTLTNQFGGEGPGVLLLLATPAPRSSILLGKNLASLLFFLPINLVATTAACFFIGRPENALPMAGLGATCLLILMALGNSLSLLAPVPLPGSRRGDPGALGGVTQPGCGTLLLRALTLLLLPALVAPAALALALGHRFLPPGTVWAILPACLAYGGVLYGAGTALALHLLETREGELVKVLQRGG